ncbi:(2Fe-2S)-binding protein [Algiphilus sp. NNCM1]|uniref:(2Fe-2S)-binding protein n=1 Tax=Algiphilus sp. TaxID=1872431 RepID=UPI001CA72EC2|nr:(2Fe-2S)-binding protein [Algiphilus sp.]MBY8964285.1 (2Fe-2S)-binding protein [Algiphilus acroporae]MCI5063407.1 (2Fe-2S)-binding protein [Algiphilus sp.]MCI5103063.1 (2Fe-2S)-binding protein [Algiphilus sp.]
MIVCSCKGIRDAQLEALKAERAEKGAIRLGDAVRALGIGTGCGRCLRHAHRLIGERCTEAPAEATMEPALWNAASADLARQTA